MYIDGDECTRMWWHLSGRLAREAVICRAGNMRHQRHRLAHLQRSAAPQRLLSGCHARTAVFPDDYFISDSTRVTCVSNGGTENFERQDDGRVRQYQLDRHRRLIPISPLIFRMIILADYADTYRVR